MVAFGILIFWHWEAFLISYLASRVIVLPFYDFFDLVQNSDYRMTMKYEGYPEDIFKFSTDPLFIYAYETKIKPYKQEFVATQDITESINRVLLRDKTALIEDANAVRLGQTYTQS